MPAHTPAEGSPRTTWCFQQEGDVWTLAYEGCTVRLRDAIGLRYLAHLLRHRGRPFHVSELIPAVGGRTIAGGTRTSERARKAVTNRIRQSAARIGAVHPGLGLHLHNTVHTGTLCVYTPDRPAPWSFGPGLWRRYSDCSASEAWRSRGERSRKRARLRREP